jgi:hypothetical protein
MFAGSARGVGRALRIVPFAAEWRNDAPQQLYRLGLGFVFENQPDRGQRRQDIAHENYHRKLRHSLKQQNKFHQFTFRHYFIWVTFSARVQKRVGVRDLLWSIKSSDFEL